MQQQFTSNPNEITNFDYHNSEKYKGYISSSQIKDFIISPKYFRWKELNPEPEKYKPHFALGSVYHDMLAAIANTGKVDNFKKNWHIFEPPVNERTGYLYGPTTKAFLEASEVAKNEAGSRGLCVESDISTAFSMVEELIGNNMHLSKDIKFLLKVGKAETSHFCVYEGFGFKHRTDLETKSKIIDWKTAPLKSIHPNEIRKQIVKFDYHITAAFYQFFNFISTGQWKSFFWVFQEKEPPYDFIIESADNWAFEITRNDDNQQIAIPKIGATILLKVLEQYIQCRETGVYPGYSIYIQPGYRGQRINRSKPPAYYQNQVTNFYDDK